METKREERLSFQRLRSCQQWKNNPIKMGMELNGRWLRVWAAVGKIPPRETELWKSIPQMTDSNLFLEVGGRDTSSDHSRELAAQNSFYTDTLQSRAAKPPAADKLSSTLELMVNSNRFPGQKGLLP